MNGIDMVAMFAVVGADALELLLGRLEHMGLEHAAIVVLAK
jgi:hypothetical protein